MKSYRIVHLRSLCLVAVVLFLGGGGCSGPDSHEQSPLADAAFTAEDEAPAQVHLSWSGYSDHRRCSMDIQTGGNWVSCTVSASVGYNTEYTYDGYCTRNKQTYQIGSISGFKLHCALDADFSDPKNVIHTETSYNGSDKEVQLFFGEVPVESVPRRAVIST